MAEAVRPRPGRSRRPPRVRIVDDGPVAAHLAFIARVAGFVPSAARPDVILLNLGSRARMQLMLESPEPPTVPVVVLAPLGELSWDFAWLEPSRVLPLPYTAPAVIGALDSCTRDRLRTPLRDELRRLAANRAVPAPSPGELRDARLGTVPAEILERALLVIRVTLAGTPGPLERATSPAETLIRDAWMSLGLDLAEHSAPDADPTRLLADATALLELLRGRLHPTDGAASAPRDDRASLVESCRLAILHGILLHEGARAAQYAAISSWFVSEITRAQEEERRHLAADLHDDVAQLLAHLSLLLDQAAAKLRDGRLAPAELAEPVHAAHELVRRVRTSASELNPSVLDDLGLGPALTWLTHRVRERTGLSIGLHLPERLERFSERCEVTAFRIVQEALTNVEKHAHASSVRVSLAVNADELRLEVVDNGRGFTVSSERRPAGQAGLGIVGMRYRARLLGGECHLESGRDGTRVAARLPLERHVGAVRVRPRVQTS
jgi:signal transduction histidine kinase